MWPTDRPVGLAVSGGPDSLALLLLAHRAIPGRFAVATVDHRLRPESAAEAAQVAQVCTQRGIAHETLSITVPAGNTQAMARQARYAALADWARRHDLKAVVTAHHSDDQAETLLMRLMRGAGLRGLASMREASQLPGAPDVVLLRPLLDWRRQALADVVAAEGLQAAQDPSNTDPRYARPALRAALASAPWLDPEMLAASAAHLADAEDALAWAAAREWDECVILDGDGALYSPAAPRAVRLRVVERIIAAMASEGLPRGSEIARLVDSLDRGEIATLAGVRAQSGDGVWRFVAAPPRRT
ncbi:tRNA lysidine(34) synthetase TilS [Novosphingobium tardum]|uniref:tRNA(Ile)-lysidine synthase n=1 Tax=Novosphingobium tardum TaxID=1538021 RepID=A0ABV8RLD3_9SPHN